MSHPLDRVRRASRVGCPFCFEWIPTPREMSGVYSPQGCLGGRCPCGAAFVIDETGRLGGQAVLDVQALVCEGDLDRAVTLESGVHVDIQTRPYQGPANTVGIRLRGATQFGPKVWFAKFIS